MMRKNVQPEKIVQQNYIERDATGVLKGVALIFMFLHHFFNMPENYIEGISYPGLEGFIRIFGEPLQICVAIFAFLTGYFYVFVPKKNVRYSLKRITDVWILYLAFFLLLLIPAAALGCWDASVKNFLLEAIGLYRPTMIFCWYVDFYIVAVLLLPLFHLGARKHIVTAVLLGLVLPFCIVVLLTDRVHIPSKNIEKLVFNLFTWFPCIASGYIFARFGLFEKWFDVLFKRWIKNKGVRIAVDVLLMGIALAGRYFLSQISINISVFTVTFSFNFLLAPLFIYGLLNLYYAVAQKKVFLPLSVLGKYSAGMWFVHCLFFNSCKAYTQPILYFPKNPLLVLLWGLLICLALSFAVTKAVAPLLRLKNKLLFKNP